MHKKKFWAVPLTAVFLVMALFFSAGSMPALASAQSRASDYLSSYNAYVYPAGNGKIQVWFTITGAGTQEALGALNVLIYESRNNSDWTFVKGYQHAQFPDMMGYNKAYHSGHVDYQGVAGRYYRAYVSIWCGGMTVGDNRAFYTASKLAS